MISQSFPRSALGFHVNRIANGRFSRGLVSLALGCALALTAQSASTASAQSAPLGSTPSGSTPSGSTQRSMRIHVTEAGRAAYDSRTRLSVDRYASGEAIMARSGQGPDGRPLAELVRLADDGSVLWQWDGGPSAPFGADDQLTKVLALPDGGALVSGLRGQPLSPTVPFLFRIAADRRVLWNVVGVGVPARDTFFAQIFPWRGADGLLFVTTLFTDGAFGLPGTAPVQARRGGGSFLARLDPDTGAVLWTRPVRGSGDGVVDANGITLVHSVTPPSVRGALPRQSQLLFERFDDTGRRGPMHRDTLPGASGARSVERFPDGHLAVVAEVCRSTDAEGRCLQEGLLLAYDASGRRVASHDVPAWSVLARRERDAPLRVVGPASIERPVVSGQLRAQTQALDIFAYSDPTTPALRSRVAVPQTVFTSITRDLAGASFAGGVLLHGETTVGGAGAGHTVLFAANGDLRPVDVIAPRASEALPPAPVAEPATASSAATL